MAQAFSRLLGPRFLFVCSGAINNELKDIPYYILKTIFFKLPVSLSIYYYFFWMPFFLARHVVSGSVLYFKDTRLAAFALFWKKILSSRIRVVIEAHIPFLYDYYVFPRADHIITITSSMVKMIKYHHNISVQKISLLPDGVDLKNFDLNISRTEARIVTNLPLDKKIILYSGSVGYYNWKGEDIFIKSAKLFDSHFLFVVVGGTSSDAEKIIGQSLPNNVLCVDRQPHNKISFYLKAADVLVLPNKKGNPRSEMLTSPLKLFEYMASSVPIVASDLTSTREVLNSNNALLVKPNDPKALADGILKIIKDKILADFLARKARIDVNKYEWQVRAERILDFINFNKSPY